MFESIKHWLDSLSQASHLFEHYEDEAIHIALASLLYHLIETDHHESRREYHYFSDILKQEFDLNDEQVKHLHEHVAHSKTNLDADLRIIDEYLSDNPVLRMKFMEKLNLLIATDGVLDKEMSLFYKTLHVVFPEIKTKE
jgi:uncharacterized tellurite resistance protein B-like protein